MKRLWFLLVSLVLLSCAPYQFIQPTIQLDGHIADIAPIYIQDTFTPYQRAQLYAAIQQWNTALNGKIVFTVENDHYHYTSDAPTNKLILLKTNHLIANQHQQYLALAWTSGRKWAKGGGIGGNRIYFVMDRIEGDNLTFIALHELAHTLSADHQQYHGLMNPIYHREDYQCIDRPTVLQVATYHHLNMDDLHWCH